MNLSTIKNFYIGNNAVSNIYMGNIQIWPTGYTQYVTSWINSITSANLTLPSQTVINATDDFIKSLHNSGLINAYKNSSNKIKRLNLFNGGDYISSFIPIICDIGATNDYNGKYGSTISSLSSGPISSLDWSLTGGMDLLTNENYVASGQIQGSTSTNTLKIIDTGVPINNSYFSNYNISMGCHITSNRASSTINVTDMGYVVGSVSLTLQCYLGSSTISSRWNCYQQDNSYVTGLGNTAGGAWINPPSNMNAFYVGSRQSQTYSTIYVNGLQPSTLRTFQNGYTATTGGFATQAINPNTYNATTGLSFDNTSLILGGRSTTANSGAGVTKTISNVASRAYGMYFISQGLTDSDVSTLTTFIRVFNSAIGRNSF